MADTVNRDHAPDKLDWKSWDDFPAPRMPIGVPVVALMVLIFSGLLIYRSIMGIVDPLNKPNNVALPQVQVTQTALALTTPAAGVTGEATIETSATSVKSGTPVAASLNKGDKLDVLSFFIPTLGMLVALGALYSVFGLWKLRNWGRISAISLLMFAIFLYSIQFLIDKSNLSFLLLLIPLAGIVYLLLPSVVQEYDKAEVS